MRARDRGLGIGALAAETMAGRDGITVHALPHDLLRQAMDGYGRRPSG